MARIPSRRHNPSDSITPFDAISSLRISSALSAYSTTCWKNISVDCQPEHAQVVVIPPDSETIPLHVASMSRGAAVSFWKRLKRNENFCDTMQHDIAAARKPID